MNTDIKNKKEKIKRDFLSGSAGDISDRELLEGIITVAFSTDRAQNITNALFSKYNSLGNILKADVASLLKIDGISEKMAVFISMLHPTMQRMMSERNEEIKNLSTVNARKSYCANMLRGRKFEALAVINLDENMNIISSRIVSEGSANFSQVSPTELIKSVMYDQPEYIIITHNHPGGSSEPSLQDFNFTINAKEIFNSVGFKLIDHIIIGSNSEYSMSESANKYFID